MQKIMLFMVCLGVVTAMYASDDLTPFDRSLPVVSFQQIQNVMCQKVTQKQLREGKGLSDDCSYVVLARLDDSEKPDYVVYASLEAIAQSSAGLHPNFPLFVVVDTGQNALRGLPRFQVSGRSSNREYGRGNPYGRGLSDDRSRVGRGDMRQTRSDVYLAPASSEDGE